MHEEACVAGSAKGGDAVEGVVGGVGCITGQVDFGGECCGHVVRLWGGWPECPQVYCHLSIFHFNEVPPQTPYYLFIH